MILFQAQQSLDLIHEELSKVTDSSDELIENSSLTSQTVRVPARFWLTASVFVPSVLVQSKRSASVKQEEIDKKEKLTAGLNQTVKELQQLLQTVSRQLSKGQEGVRTVASLTHWEKFRCMLIKS